MPDSALMDMVVDVSPQDLDNIAIQHLGIKPHEIHDICVAVRENIQMRKFQILELWRNRYTGQDPLGELQGIMRDQQRPGLYIGNTCQKSYSDIAQMGYCLGPLKLTYHHGMPKDIVTFIYNLEL